MKRLRTAILLAAGMVPFAALAFEGDPAKGQAKASVCAACHGPDGNSSIPMYPNLAGQIPEYLYKQLRDYKSGQRQNPIMSAQAAALSDEEMRNLASHFAAQKPRPGVASDPQKARAGQRLYKGGNTANGLPACAGCHSPTGAGIPSQYPRLKGQPREYTIAQLQAFRGGQRANDGAMMMRAIAARLSDRDMDAVAEYITGLK
jgi:cytochrome c553